jgi:replication factor A1
MINDYHRVLKKVAEISQKSEDEITRLVEAKRAKLSGLISREGALQIVAAELGINFEKQKVKINEIFPGMKKINLIGKIIRMFPVREFKKGDREGKVANLIIADDTGNIKTVLWDANHTELVEKREIKEGDFVHIENANLRNNEIHLSGFSEIKISPVTIDNVKTEQEYTRKNLSETKIGEYVEFRAFIVQVFEPKFFEVCPECKKRVVNNGESATCEAHGKVIPEKKALFSAVLDDGTDIMRATFFLEQIKELGMTLEELENSFVQKKEEILGKEFIFSGNVRQNKLFNNPEFYLQSLKEVSIPNLIEELEKAK